MNRLFMTALYSDSATNYNKLFGLIQDSQCTLVHLDLQHITPDIACITATFKGDWNQLTRFETRFSSLKNTLLFSTLQQVDNIPNGRNDSIPYSICILMPNLPQNTYKLIAFINTLNTTVHTFSLTSYETPLTSVSMLKANLTTLLPFDQSITVFRENLLHFCDESNFEVLLEPIY